MKRLSTLLVVTITMLLTCGLSQARAAADEQAEYAAVEGIAYRIDKAGKTATVVQETYEDEDGNFHELCDEYSGDIVVPESITVGGAKYSVTGIGDKAFYSADITSIAIPSTVSSLGEGFAANCENLRKIVVAEGNQWFKTIDGVLYDAETTRLIKVPAGRETLTIPSTVVGIAYGSIEYTNLRTLVIPNTVTTVDEAAVRYNDRLKTLIIGSGVESIGEFAFGYNDALKSVFSRNPKPAQLPEGEIIDEDSQERTTLFVPDGSREKYLSTQYWNTFANVREYSLAGIDTYSGVASAASVVVDGIAYDLNKQNMTATVVSSFYSTDEEQVDLCPRYEGDVAVPEEITVDGVDYTVTEIGQFAFTMCKVSFFSLPNTLKRINRGAFSSVWGLKWIVIPASVEEIVGDAFALNYDLEELELAEGNTHFVYENNMLMSADRTRLVSLLGALDLEKSIEVTIPSTIKTIEDYALYGSSAITSLTLPEGLETIGVQSLGCISVKTLHIPSTVTSIGSGFLMLARKLEELTVAEGNPNFVAYDKMLLSKDMKQLWKMPTKHDTYTVLETVTEIMNSAATDTEATSLVIPDGVKTLGGLAFAFNECLETLVIGSGIEDYGSGTFFACDALKSVYLRSEQVVTPTALPFYDDQFDTTTLYVPTGTKALYASDPYWGQFKTIEEYSLTDVNKIVGDGSVERIYGIDGAARRELRRGVNVVVRKNGQTVKVVH